MRFFNCRNSYPCSFLWRMSDTKIWKNLKKEQEVKQTFFGIILSAKISYRIWTICICVIYVSAIDGSDERYCCLCKPSKDSLSKECFKYHFWQWVLNLSSAMKREFDLEIFWGIWFDGIEEYLKPVMGQYVPQKCRFWDWTSFIMAISIRHDKFMSHRNWPYKY